MDQIRKRLITLFKTIGIQGDLEKEADKMLSVIFKRNLRNLLENADEKKKKDLQEKIRVSPDTKQIENPEIFEDIFSKEVMAKTLFETTKDIMTEYIKAIVPTLSKEKKKEVVKLAISGFTEDSTQ